MSWIRAGLGPWALPEHSVRSLCKVGDSTLHLHQEPAGLPANPSTQETNRQPGKPNFKGTQLPETGPPHRITYSPQLVCLVAVLTHQASFWTQTNHPSRPSFPSLRKDLVGNYRLLVWSHNANFNSKHGVCPGSLTPPSQKRRDCEKPLSASRGLYSSVGRACAS